MVESRAKSGLIDPERGVTAEDLLRLTGKARNTIRDRLGGLEPASSDGRSKWYEAGPALEALYAAKGLDLNRERAKLAEQQTEAQELKNAQARGELVPFDVFEEVLESLSVELRQAFLSLPTKLAPRLYGLSTAELEAAIRADVNAVLEDLAGRATVQVAGRLSPTARAAAGLDGEPVGGSGEGPQQGELGGAGPVEHLEG